MKLSVIFVIIFIGILDQFLAFGDGRGPLFTNSLRHILRMTRSFNPPPLPKHFRANLLRQQKNRIKQLAQENGILTPDPGRNINKCWICDKTICKLLHWVCFFFSVLGGTSQFGQFSGALDYFSNVDTRIFEEDWNQIWEQTGTVPDKVPGFPDDRMMVRFPSGVMVRPNDTLTSGLVITITNHGLLTTNQLIVYL